MGHFFAVIIMLSLGAAIPMGLVYAVWRNATLKKALTWALGICAVSVVGGFAAAALQAPREADVLPDAPAAQPAAAGYVVASRSGSGSLRRFVIVVPAGKATQESVRAAAGAIATTYKDMSHLYVSIFDDERAADAHADVVAGKASAAAIKHHDRHFVGELVRNATTGLSRLSLHLGGLGGKSTEVDMAAAQPAKTPKPRPTPLRDLNEVGFTVVDMEQPDGRHGPKHFTIALKPGYRDQKGATAVCRSLMAGNEHDDLAVDLYDTESAARSAGGHATATQHHHVGHLVVQREAGRRRLSWYPKGIILGEEVAISL